MPFYVIGGQAVNAYVEPLVSLDLDLAVAVESLDDLERNLAKHFRVEHFAHSRNVSLPGSGLRGRIQTDERGQRRSSQRVGHNPARRPPGRRAPGQNLGRA